jgi:hypothetical protein
MSIDTEATQLIDSQRQERLRALESEEGTARLEEFQPGTFGCHELLDRTILLAEQVENTLLSHPACIQNREWYELASEASAALHELYQRISSEHLGVTEKHSAVD